MGESDDVLHGKTGELVVISGDRGDGDGQAESFGSRVSLCSSTSILMADDDHDEAESSLMVADPTTQQAEHQDDLSPLLASLSVRTGLSAYYKEKSQSFADLSLVTSLQDLPKKTITYNTRMKAQRGQAFAGASVGRSSISCHRAGSCSKVIAKKAIPRGSSDRLLSRLKSKEQKNHLRV